MPRTKARVLQYGIDELNGVTDSNDERDALFLGDWLRCSKFSELISVPYIRHPAGFCDFTGGVFFYF